MSPISAGKGWVLPGRGNYPADFDQVRHTLIGLAALETIAPKTARADWLHYVGLDTPPKGNGTEFIVKRCRGQDAGVADHRQHREFGDPNGAIGLFVRHPGDNQSYLARTVFTPHGDRRRWLDTSVMIWTRRGIQQVDHHARPRAPATPSRRAMHSDRGFS